MPKKIYSGKVVSDKMDKTIVVAVTRTFQHPLYKKTIRSTTKLKAHDSDNSCKTGDVVSIVESRPMSKTKRWQLVKKTERGGL
ncbi:MAG: 30S ribosomal protein S17 [Nitrospirae bacterium]|nr:30S ribosomal protein S17 [Nitrospirota bacterium]